ncbi:MAG: tRNA pseudouridine(13) synthase TruD [archaeon]|jgi:TruD family tRNA pseudouridine synthase
MIDKARPHLEEKQLFEHIGISYKAIDKKIKGTLYSKVEDFVVEEFHVDNMLCTVKKENTIYSFTEGSSFVHATLVKKNLSTFEACQVFAQKNNLDYFTEVKCCGLKDTNGFTAQRICFKNIPLKQTEFNDFFLKDFKNEESPLSINGHAGNKFTVVVRNVEKNKENLKLLEDFKNKIKKGLPNFYGPQRFGVRQHNHKLGKLLLKKRFREYLHEFLTHSENEPESIKVIRQEIKANFGDWKTCHKIINNSSELSDEKGILEKLIETNNELEAIKSMKLTNFFVHSYSSYLFNLALSTHLFTSEEDIELEKIGNNTDLANPKCLIFEKILENEQMSLEDFNSSNELFHVKNHSRKALFYPKNFNYFFTENDLVVSFELGNGEYASLVLGFLIEEAFGKLN